MKITTIVCSDLKIGKSIQISNNIGVNSISKLLARLSFGVIKPNQQSINGKITYISRYDKNRNSVFLCIEQIQEEESIFHYAVIQLLGFGKAFGLSCKVSKTHQQKIFRRLQKLFDYFAELNLEESYTKVNQQIDEIENELKGYKDE